MTQAQIMAEYLALEKAARAQTGLLLPEDVMACVDATARRLGLDHETVKDAVRVHSAMGMG